MPSTHAPQDPDLCSLETGSLDTGGSDTGGSDTGGAMHPSLLLTALFLPSLGAMCFAVWFAESSCSMLLYWGTKILMLALPVGYFGLRPLARLFRSRGEQPNRASAGRAAYEGFWSGVLILGFAAALSQIPAIANELESAATRVHARMDSLDFAQAFLGIALYVTFVHSVLEEIYWRGLVFHGLRARCQSIHTAHAITAIGFAANHLILTLRFFTTEIAILFTLFVAVGGWIWTWMAQRHRSLVGSTVSHMIVDALLMGVAYCWVASGGGS